MDGQVGAAWVGAVCVLLAAVLLSAVGVAALRSDTAGADTVLARGAGVVLTLADGTTRDAVEGETVPRGATVRAGRTGARLDTREREVHLGADTAVTVVDGARQVLRAGFVMVDASSAPGLELQTAAAAVEAADDSLVRVDGGPLLRVGVLRGGAAQVRPTGRRTATELPTYFQVQVPAGGLPGTTAPFVLTPGDAYEMQLAGELVAADADLGSLAFRLDADGNAGPAVLAALTQTVQAEPVAPGAPLSERTLGYLIAAAAQDDGALGDRYARVRALRTAGGSWGVVAAIVQAPVDRVSAALNALLDPDAVPTVAAERFDLSELLGGGAAAPGPDSDEPAPSVTGPEPSQEEPDRPSEQPQPEPQPTSSPSPSSPPPGPTDPVTDVVEEVADTVLYLLSPSPSPSPSGPAGVGVPSLPPLPLLDEPQLLP
jgi:hypothetical protein